MKTIARLTVIAGALLLASTELFGQSSETAAIVGRLTAANAQPIAGAIVSVDSSRLIGGPRTAETTKDGSYRITGLAAGVYDVEVALQGFQPATRRARLSVDSTAIVDIVLQITPVVQEIEAVGVLPVVDMTTAAIPLRLESDVVDHLPTNRRVSDFMNLLPGVNANIGFGGTQQSNGLYIEGVNATDGQSSAPSLSMDANWLESVQVIGLGAGAQYGEFSGIVQKSTLKSGSNNFRGAAEYRTSHPRWASRNTRSLSAVSKEQFHAQSERVLVWRDLDAQLGGPIRRDRVWFFAGVQQFQKDWTPALFAGPGSTSDGDRRVLARINTALARWPQVNAFYLMARHETKAAGLGPLTPVETTTTDTEPIHSWQVNVRSARRTYTVELASSGSNGAFHVDPTGPGTREGPYPHYDASTGLSSGNAYEYFDSGTRRSTTTATLIHARDVASTQHLLNAGIEHDRITVTTLDGIPGGRAYIDLEGSPYQVDLWASDRTWAQDTRTTFYAQEKWTVGRGITVEPGVRLSLNRGHVSQRTVVHSHPVSPRMGVAWDVARDHSTVVRGHFGRYHDALLTANFQLIDTDVHPPLITASVVGPEEFVEISRSSSSRHAMAPQLSQPYFDQWTLGVERAITHGLQLNAHLVWRRYENLTGYIDTGSVYAPLSVTDPGRDGRVGTNDDGPMVTIFKKTNPGNELFYFTNPPGAYRRYAAAQFIGRYRRGYGWYAQASYTHSKTRGNVENAGRSNSGGPETGTNGVFSDPNRATNGDGLSSFDYTHEVKVLATAQPKWLGGLRLSGVYQYRSGLALGRTAQFPAIGQVIFGVRMERRGTQRLKALNSLDVRMEHTFRLSAERTVGMYADVFNVNNQGIPDSTRRRAVSEISGPTFGQPLFWVSPRTARVGIRLAF